MTRMYLAYLVATSIGVVGLGIEGGSVSMAQGQSAGQSLQNAGQSVQNAGSSLGNAAGQASQGISQGAQAGAQDLKSRLSSAVENVQTDAKLSDVKDRVAKLVDASVSGDNLGDIQNYVDKDAQSRLKDVKADDTLKKDLKQLQDDYKSKYHKDLSFKDDSDKLFDHASSFSAKVKDPDQLHQWPIQRQQGSSVSMAGLNSGSSNAGSSSSAKDIKKGDEIAVITLRSPQGQGGQSQGSSFNSSHSSSNHNLSSSGLGQGTSAGAGQTSSNQGTPYGTGQMSANQGTSSGTGQTTSGIQGQGTSYGSSQSNASQGQHSQVVLSAVKQGDDWRISVPQSLDADRLQRNLQQEVRQVLNQKSQWPSDADQARRLIATRVLNAFYDTGSGNDTRIQQAGER